MFCLRLTPLALSLFALAACTVKVPVRTGVKVSVNATTPVAATASASTGASGSASATVSAQVPLPPPPPPQPVALEGAAVVEFFGIPLDGAEDVVFVLDRSGSMIEPAQGRIAEIHVAAPPEQVAPPVEVGVAPVNSASRTPGVEIEVAPGVPVELSPGDPNVAPGHPVDVLPPPPPQVIQPRKIDVAHAELVHAVQELPAGTRMNVIFFNEQLEGFAATLVRLEDSARPGLVSFVRSMDATGSTALAPAMRTAFLMNARRIVLLSDGLANVGGDAEAVLRDAREAIRGGVRVDTIGLGQHQDVMLLEALARESGGLYQAL